MFKNCVHRCTFNTLYLVRGSGELLNDFHNNNIIMVGYQLSIRSVCHAINCHDTTAAAVDGQCLAAHLNLLLTQ